VLATQTWRVCFAHDVFFWRFTHEGCFLEMIEALFYAMKAAWLTDCYRHRTREGGSRSMGIQRRACRCHERRLGSRSRCPLPMANGPSHAGENLFMRFLSNMRWKTRCRGHPPKRCGYGLGDYGSGGALVGRWSCESELGRGPRHPGRLHFDGRLCQSA
jgi:hypothetical protein